jgi:large subunit ribosomal protein L15
MALKLSELSRGNKKRKVSRRIGRGEGSGAGKTSGRGGKGQTARTGGKVAPHFEGGQMPLYRRIPKLGFTSRKGLSNKNVYHAVNVGELESFADGASISIEQASRIGIGRSVSKHGAGVKLLAGGTLSKRVSIEVNAASEAAISAVEKAGGSVTIVERM